MGWKTRDREVTSVFKQCHEDFILSNEKWTGVYGRKSCDIFILYQDVSRYMWNINWKGTKLLLWLREMKALSWVLLVEIEKSRCNWEHLGGNIVKAWWLRERGIMSKFLAWTHEWVVIST